MQARLKTDQTEKLSPANQEMAKSLSCYQFQTPLKSSRSTSSIQQKTRLSKSKNSSSALSLSPAKLKS